MTSKRLYARFWVSSLTWFTLASPLLGVLGEVCPRQHLVRCRPHDMGVAHFSLLGQVHSIKVGRMQAVILQGFVKLYRTYLNTTQLFGYAWMEDDGPLPSPCGPQHAHLLQGLPRMELHPITPRDSAAAVSIQISIGQDHVADSKNNFAFRLDATINSIVPTVFLLRVDRFDRAVVLNIADMYPLHGLITPWFNMSTHPHCEHLLMPGPSHDLVRGLPSRRSLLAATVPTPDLPPVPAPSSATQRRRLQQVPDPAIGDWLNTAPPPERSPLVLVMHMSNQKDAPGHTMFQAKEILRYIEYHILQAGMQRVLIYARPQFYMHDEWRAYIARHMDPRVVPFVTFVLWSLDMEYSGGYWDQHYAYYHAATALSAHWSVLAVYPDLDEYIAWPRPAQTLHEALSLCDSAKRQYFPMVSVYTNCEVCLDNYLKDIYADMHMWESLETDLARAIREGANVSETNPTTPDSCRWYKSDPLALYSRMLDDTVIMKDHNLTWDQAVSQYGVWQYRGKQMSRIQAVRGFNMHRAELFVSGDEMRSITPQHPDRCPFIAHLLNIHEYRGNWTWGGRDNMVKGWRSKWWIVPEA